MRTVQRGLQADGARVVISEEEVDMEDRPYSPLTLVAELARSLHRSPLEVEGLLESSSAGMTQVVDWVSRHNALLYDHVLPAVFKGMFIVESWQQNVTDQVLLVREPPSPGYYPVHAAPEKVVSVAQWEGDRTRSFHLDHYCFDSEPELAFFLAMLGETRQVDKVYFTGMLTHGQTDFFVDYIDPITQANRSYYPDFLVHLKGGRWLVIEVKGDDMKDDPVVRAKAASARELADASRMEYRVILASQVLEGRSTDQLSDTWMDQYGGRVS